VRIYAENITADDTDVLAGTSLDVLEGGGQLDIYAISTQADTLMTILGPDQEPIATSIELPQQTRSISITDDPSYSLVVVTGGHFTISIDITTAATVQILVIYRKAGVDF